MGTKKKPRYTHRAQAWASKGRTVDREIHHRQHRLQDGLPAHSLTSKTFPIIPSVPGHRHSVVSKNFCLKKCICQKEYHSKIMLTTLLTTKTWKQPKCS